MGNICNSGDICKTINDDNPNMPKELDAIQRYQNQRYNDSDEENDDDVIIGIE